MNYRDLYTLVHQTPPNQTPLLFQVRGVDVEGKDLKSITPLALSLYLLDRLEDLEIEVQTLRALLNSTKETLDEN